MKLAHNSINYVFDLSPHVVNVLIVEREQLLYDYLCELKAGISEDGGNFFLSDGDDIVKLSKVAVLVSDLLNIEADNKKTTAKLFAELKSIAEEDYFTEVHEIYTGLYALIESLNVRSSCSVDYDTDIDFSAILKAMGVHISTDVNTLVEKIVTFINVSAKYLGIKLFFFVNLKCFVPENELVKIYKHVELLGASLMLIENSHKAKIPGETSLIIDKDLCEILV